MASKDGIDTTTLHESIHTVPNYTRRVTLPFTFHESTSQTLRKKHEKKKRKKRSIITELDADISRLIIQLVPRADLSSYHFTHQFTN